MLALELCFCLEVCLSSATLSHARAEAIEEALALVEAEANQARLALDDAQHPQFSFMRYIINEPKEKTGADASTISDADGGGILNFLVLYDTDSAKVKAAEAALRELKENEEMRHFWRQFHCWETVRNCLLTSVGR